nr:hypothetical protein [Tanacetum cinerariifolium]
MKVIVPHIVDLDLSRLTITLNSGEKGGSAKELVSTARPEDSTVRPDVGTADPIAPPTTINSSRPARSILTLKPLLTIDLKDKGKVRLVYEKELAELEREKEKRQREEEASKASIAEMYDEFQARIKANALFLKAKTFTEIQGLYERKKRMIDDFKPMDSNDSVDKEKVLEEPNSTKESKFYHLDRYGVECIYYRIFRSDGSSRWIKMFSKMVTRFDRMDLEELYNLVVQRLKTTSLEGVDLVLWGDLRTMFEKTADDDLWKNQEEWILNS